VPEQILAAAVRPAGAEVIDFAAAKGARGTRWGPVAQWAALAATTGDQSQLAQMVSEYVERRDALISALSTIEGVRPFTPRGAFYVWAELDPAIYERLGVADANELSDKLAAIGIGSAPGSAFGQTCDDAIRFAYSCATPMVKEGAEALKKALSDPDVLHGRKQA
jgi:aspartate aminotransferase